MAGSLFLCADIEKGSDVELSDFVDEVHGVHCVGVGAASNMVDGGHVKLRNMV